MRAVFDVSSGLLVLAAVRRLTRLRERLKSVRERKGRRDDLPGQPAADWHQRYVSVGRPAANGLEPLKMEDIGSSRSI